MKRLGIIAGSGQFPITVAQGARQQGVDRIVVVAFHGETNPAIETVADVVVWMELGQLNEVIHCFKSNGSESVVMAGQITPTKLFSNLKLDLRMAELMQRVKFRGAAPLFGSIAEELTRDGIQLVDSSMFVRDQLAEDRVMTRKTLTEAQARDIRKGRELARAIADLDIGQTLVMKEGAVVAVEAIEGTNETIRRAGRLAGPDSLVVKVVKTEQDRRFDLPVVGPETIHVMHEAGAVALALDPGGAIMVHKEEMLRLADAEGIIVTGAGTCA